MIDLVSPIISDTFVLLECHTLHFVQCGSEVHTLHQTGHKTKSQSVCLSSHALLKGRKLKSKEEHEERYKKYDQQQLQICFW